MSLRSAIRDVQDGSFVIVEVPEWKGITDDGSVPKFAVVSMDGEQRARYLRAAMTEDGEPNFEAMYPQLAISTVCEAVEHDDEPGKLRPGDYVFVPEDAEWLNSKNASALERLAEAALEQAGMKKAAEAAAGKGS